MAGEACRPVLIVGSATVTIVVSSSAMKAPTSTMETARQPCPSAAGTCPEEDAPRAPGAEVGTVLMILVPLSP